MAVATATRNAEFLNIVAGVPINVNFPLFERSHIRGYYGDANLQADPNTDFAITLMPEEFGTFRVTPSAALIAKINALIASDPDERNRFFIERVLPLTTTSTPALCQSTTFVSREFDRLAMKLMQLNGGGGGGGGGGGIGEAPDDGFTYGRKNLAWARVSTGGGGGGGGGGATYSSRAIAEAADVPVGTDVISVLHSGQVLFYRRYTEGGVGETYAPLKTNSGAVSWSPAADACPLHWGAMGDGVTNDRTALQNMMRFYFGTPATNGSMPASWAGQRPLVVTGHQRTYGIAAPLVWGNLGTSVDTGMVYNFRLKDIRFKAIDGDWGFPLIANVAQRYMLMAGWNFQNDYTDEYSGLYDVMLDHVTFDAQFKTGWTWVCNTYQFVMNQCRYQHIAIDHCGCDTSIRNSLQGTRPFGFNTGNGAYTLLGPNFEGLVGESGLEYPEGRTIDTMGTIAFRVYTNDFRVDAPIASRCTTALDIWGSAGQIYNLHPWSREVRVRTTANNVMFCNGYLDYTKFILESFQHMFVGMHWILPTGTGADRGVELRASVANEDGDGLLFSGCTFGGESLDVRYTTTGAGTWVGEKNRKVTMIGCSYRSGHTIAQIERFQDKRGYTVASGAHWFRALTNDTGECRLVGDALYIGKDRTLAGSATLQLQGTADATPSVWLSAYALGGGALQNVKPGAFFELGVQAEGSAIFIDGTTARVNIKRKFIVENVQNEQDSLQADNGDIRSNWGVAVGAKRILALTDTVAGARFTTDGGVIHRVAGSPSTSACINLGRGEAGSLLRGSINGVTSSGAGINIASGGTMSYATTSDARLKQDFQPIDPALIDMFDAYDYEWIANPGPRHQGVKAQELLNVVPDAVTGSGIVDKPEGWDELHLNDPWEPQYHGVDYSLIVPLLIATIKDLRARVAVLEGN